MVLTTQVVVVVVVDVVGVAVRRDMFFFQQKSEHFIQRGFIPISNGIPTCLATCPHDTFHPLVKSL